MNFVVFIVSCQLFRFLSVVKCSKNAFGVIEDYQYWKDLALSDIQEALSHEKNENVAKNVILFIGDGLGPETQTAARIHSKYESEFLAFEKFPNMGTLKTYSANKLVPDSCSTATAMFSGIKVNHKTVGVDATVELDECNASLKESARLGSVLKWAQDAGKSTGFVTTTRVTHATPAPLYAHSPNRNWECEAKIPLQSRHCKDIARQLIEDEPGKNIKVIMGGGRQVMQSNVTGSEADPLDTWSCYSQDGRDLIKDWENDKKSRGVKYAVVDNNEELKDLNTDSEYVLGIFANGHLKYEHVRDKGPSGMPSLKDMTDKAIEVLKKDKNGFFLMVEGGLIDFGHHRGHAGIAIEEVESFSNAIESTLTLMKDVAYETFVMVTADHAHSMIMTGYPDRRSSILGIAGKSPMDGMSYTTLLYGTGGPNNYQFIANNSEVTRLDPALNDTESLEYSQQAVVLADEVYHSGTDVHIYAMGPMAHLIQNTHEQTYVAYLISYAAKIGPFKDTTNSVNSTPKGLLITGFSALFIIIINVI